MCSGNTFEIEMQSAGWRNGGLKTQQFLPGSRYLGTEQLAEAAETLPARSTALRLTVQVRPLLFDHRSALTGRFPR